ncbi:hypothetical protein E8E13_006810 [Curvularia kusanoi]|uniref:Heterokaryon incompatibility domain-containing protein n=1 Tax=Curvularia kusanoi TaxID=90978 RepID=A0A9P4T8C0_CURKU|nr:hypothetical protein E8E13_006810 [Curvularia kusanoi]
MRLIYSLAAEVVIWLGPESRNSDKAMELIIVLSDACKNGTDKSLGAEFRRNPEYIGGGAWLALSQLLERTYWHRMWIIQELCLAGTKAPILCGKKFVTWEQFYSALHTFGKHNTDIMFACIDHERKAAGLSASGLSRNKIIHIDFEHRKQAGNTGPQYMPLLDLARHSDASNPRDKIYGLLGLMDPAVSSVVTLDYNLSVEDVYTEFTRQYIEATQNLEILQQCRLGSSLLPSWVPDWRNKGHYRLFSGSHSPYKAGKGSLPSYRFRDDSHVLEIDGIVLDTVDGLGPAYFEHATSSMLEHGMFEPSNVANAYGSEESIKDAVWRTLTGDRTLRGRPTPDSYAAIMDLPD